MDEHSGFRLDGFDADLLTSKRLRLEDYVEFAARARGVRASFHQPFDVMDVVDVTVQVDVAAP